MLSLTSGQETETKHDAVSQPPGYHQPQKACCYPVVTMTRGTRALKTPGGTPAEAAQKGQTCSFQGRCLGGWGCLYA